MARVKRWSVCDTAMVQMSPQSGVAQRLIAARLEQYKELWKKELWKAGKRRLV